MFNWLTNTSNTEPRLSARKTLRTITTERGTRFDVFAETAHFVMCNEPENNRDTPSEALLDFEDMALHGYWLCHICDGSGSYVVFEKRMPPG